MRSTSCKAALSLAIALMISLSAIYLLKSKRSLSLETQYSTPSENSRQNDRHNQSKAEGSIFNEAKPGQRTTPLANQTTAGEKVVPELLEKAVRKIQAYDQPGEAAEFYRLKRLPEGETEIPVDRYFVAREHMRLMPQYSSALGRQLPSLAEMKEAEAESATWTSLGPGNIGGRTRALLINPADAQVMYAAGVAGGVWKTVNGGASWTPLGDMLPNLAVNSMVMDPRNPNVIYAGTGEGFFNSDAVRGAGIFKTTDGGATWTRLENTTGQDFHYVNDIAISPVNSQRVYAATRAGVFRSTDGGATWAKTLDPQLGAGCLDLAIRSDQSTDFLFASCGSFQQAAVYRNTDAAASSVWTEVLKDAGMGRASLAISPSNQNVVYAASASIAGGAFQNGLHAIFRSTNGGEPGSWTPQTRNTNPTKLNTVLFSNPLGAFLGECGLAPSVFNNQGWYDNVIAVDPIDPNRLWLGGIDLFRSDDGGANWGLASYWWADKNNPHYAHADHHVIVFHPQYNGSTNRRMFIGTDGGIFRTDDARASVATGSTAACNPNATGVTWTSLNNNFGVTQFYHGAVFPDGKSYFGGTQDNGTLLGTDDAGVGGWREIFGGDGGYVAVNPNDPNQIYLETTRLSLRKSTNGGTNFGRAIAGIDESPGNFPFIAPFAIDPSNPQRLWIGGKTLWRSINGAANWAQASTPLPDSSMVTAIAVSPTNANLIAVGTQIGYAYLLAPALVSDATSSVVQNTPGRFGYVSSVAFDPNNYRTFYVTYSTFGGKHVWRAADFGNDWSPIDGSGPNALPDIPVNTIAIDPANTARIYVGTDVGLFVTTDGGANWAVETTGFVNAPVESLAINTNDGAVYLYAFTHGRGVWRVKISDVGCNLALSSRGQSFGVVGGQGSVQVAAVPAGCAWQAESNERWIAITSVTSNVANFSVAPNDTYFPRTGTIAIAGKSFTVTQPSILDNDTIAPTVRITEPTTTSVYQTKVGGITLRGTASDNAAVVGGQLIVSDRGSERRSTEGGLYTGTVNWSIDSRMPLQSGINNFTVTARDPAGNQSSAKLKVTYTPEYIINKVTGGLTKGYAGDGGPAINAVFNDAQALTVDRTGNIYIADTYNHRIRKIGLDGKINTVAGNGVAGFGGDGGPATSAQINLPFGVAVDATNNLYVLDSGNYRVRKVTPNGIISTIAGNGTGGFGGDGGLATAATLAPRAIVLDSAANIYIADNYRVRKITAATGIINTIAGNGRDGFSGDGGPALAASFSQGPISLAIDRIGNLYTLEYNRVRKIDPTGNINTVAGGVFPLVDGEEVPARSVGLYAPRGIAVDSENNLYITESPFEANRVRKVSPSGIIWTVAGGGTVLDFRDGEFATSVWLHIPWNVAISESGRIYIINLHQIAQCVPITADTIAPTIAITSPTTNSFHATAAAAINVSGTTADNNSVRQVTWATDRGKFGIAEGTSNWTIKNLPLQFGINNLTVTVWDQLGNSASAVLTINYDPGPFIKRVAGAGTRGFNLETGSAASAQLWSPETVAIDLSGNLFIADTGNHRIRKVARDGTITTFAGNGQIGSRGDGGQAVNAEFNSPNGVVVDASGVVYVADTNNHRVRRIAPSGVITTIAGTGIDGFSGDGGAAMAAKLDTPVGLALDGAGNLFIADAGNHRVRKLNLSTGVISTAAGNGYGSGGDGGAALDARLFFPTGMAFDRAGNLYVADTGNHRIRKVTPSGIISTVAGTGSAGFSGDGGAAQNAQINAPGG